MLILLKLILINNVALAEKTLRKTLILLKLIL